MPALALDAVTHLSWRMMLMHSHCTVLGQWALACKLLLRHWQLDAALTHCLALTSAVPQGNHRGSAWAAKLAQKALAAVAWLCSHKVRAHPQQGHETEAEPSLVSGL